MTERKINIDYKDSHLEYLKYIEQIFKDYSIPYTYEEHEPNATITYQLPENE